MTGTGTMRAKGRELRERAARLPLARAIDPQHCGSEMEFFAQIDRELTWGLTLNK